METALILPVVLMVLLGIITVGITHHHNISLESAAREASRFGATYPVGGSVDDWLRDVATVAEDAANGSVDATVPSRLICVAHGSGDAASGFTRLAVSGSQAIGSANSAPGWCFPNEAPGEDTVVQVRLERDGTVEALVFSMTPRLNAEATTKFERSG